MYNARMNYHFKKGKLEEGVKIWKEGVYSKIKNAKGFIRVQLYTTDQEMLAIGTWEDKTNADAFMQSGVFKDLMGAFGELLEKRPVNCSMDLRFFEEK